MIRRLFTECLLEVGDIAPSHDDMQVVGLFNPGVVEVDGEVIMLVRVAERPIEDYVGRTALPRYVGEGEIVVDHLSDDELHAVDPRVVIQKKDGCSRLTFVSHLCIVRSKDGKVIDSVDNARFIPANEYEWYGVEDPRITPIDGRYYITYVSVSKHGASTSLAVTDDFESFERLGVIFLPDNKDVLLFPQKIGGKYVAMHRPSPAMRFTQPEMWISFSEDLIHWGEHKQLLGSRSHWDVGRIGGGCPPVLTEAGWLEIYHGNDKMPGVEGVGSYFGGAFMMDRDEPWRIVGHSDGPIMQATADFETEGFVDNVVFPTGIIERGDQLLVYYGAADERCGVVGFSRDEVLEVVMAVGV